MGPLDWVVLAAAAAASEPASPAERLAGLLSAERMAEHHRVLTARPHVAGTPGGHAVAEAIAARLRNFGLATEVRRYQAWLSYPRRLRVGLTEPEQRELPVSEPVDPAEPDAAHAELLPGFVAYSASGFVEAPVVYASYGLPSDYEALAAAGVAVRGNLVLVRYGKVHRAVKLFGAESRGARGVLLYSDPADDGAAKGEVWPKGPWRAPFMLQRGNAKYSWHWHGDPLTPAVPARGDAKRLERSSAPTLPALPAVALSAEAGQALLAQLSGPEAPPSFEGGLGIRYRLGGAGARVRLEVEMEEGTRTIFDVLGRIEGGEEPDREVILGTHHDAWTFGAVDPGSAGAVLLELGRALGELRSGGWRPRRSIVLAFWDAEEYGLVGSTEYAEDRAAELRERAVAYINTDMYLPGPLRPGGSPSLRAVVSDAARAVADPAGGGSLFDAWKGEAWQALGSGADFVPFQDHLGLPTLSLELGSLTAYGSYHSAYDTRRYFEGFVDPGWRHGRALGELLGRVALRLAEDQVLPFRAVPLAEALAGALNDLGVAHRGADLRAARQHVARLSAAAGALDAALASVPPALNATMRRAVNDALVRAETALAPPDDERWYRNVLYGWDIYALYGGQTLPALRQALRAGDASAVAAEARRLEQAVARAAEALEDARAALPLANEPLRDGATLAR
jgi:N-acetylated-alpha-linked acidic dipeptidase